jgi:FkbM family methyltransferase
LLMTKKRGVSFAKIIGGGFAIAARAISAPLGRRIGTRALAYAAVTMPRIVKIETPKGVLQFWCASASAAKRSVGFMKYEPDTRDWIDTCVRPGEHVWDVGANIGAFTLYACLRDGVTATAFEPVAGTFAILARNIAINGLETRVTPLCMALSNADGLVPIYLASTEPGEAMHALSAPETVRGAFEPKGRQTILAMRGESIVRSLGVPVPDHIKIDVDGHELRVLKGMEAMLASVRTLWVEMIDAADVSGENARITEFLNGLGFDQQPLATEHKGRNRLFVNRARRT